MSKHKFKHMLKALRYPTMNLLSKKVVLLRKWLKGLNWGNIIYISAMVAFITPTVGELIINAIHKKLVPTDLYRIALFAFYVLVVTSKLMIDHYRDMFDDILQIAKAQQVQIEAMKKIIDMKLGINSDFSLRKKEKKEEDLKN